ncbi:MAG: hypothetical protein OXH14_00695 [Alphaproteobacteria bacterium]|nr:hypothetical protein [Alphaproteobacteria bacterium]MYE59904.1 hypothetical protein [Alphaproteobacteria bacterium]
MPLQNRVTPFGDIVAAPERGTMMGNRGILHDERQMLGGRRWTHKAWICCVTEFRGRKRQVMAPGRYTELFFLDEAVALAAGHRPCFECRREAAKAYAACWGGSPRAGELDRVLHAERLDGRRRLVHIRELAELPDGAFVSRAGAAWLVRGPLLLRYTPGGYDAVIERPAGAVEVLTPPATLRTLKAGYAPLLHPSAEAPPAP